MQNQYSKLSQSKDKSESEASVLSHDQENIATSNFKPNNKNDISFPFIFTAKI